MKIYDFILGWNIISIKGRFLILTPAVTGNTRHYTILTPAMRQELPRDKNLPFTCLDWFIWERKNSVLRSKSISFFVWPLHLLHCIAGPKFDAKSSKHRQLCPSLVEGDKENRRVEFHSHRFSIFKRRSTSYNKYMSLTRSWWHLSLYLFNTILQQILK